MNKNAKSTSRQQVIGFISRNPGCSFSDVVAGTGLDKSPVNCSLWAMTQDGRLRREGDQKSYRYWLSDECTVIESGVSGGEVSFPFTPVFGGQNPLTYLFNQCLAGVRK